MKQPIGFEDGSSKVCKLLKSLYGLKQAPRCWNARFVQFLKDCGINNPDSYVFYSMKQEERLIFGLYVDDYIIAAKDLETIERLINYLKQGIKLKIGNLDSFLGIQFKFVSDESIFMNQMQYVKQILARFNIGECKFCSCTNRQASKFVSIWQKRGILNLKERFLISSMKFIISSSSK